MRVFFKVTSELGPILFIPVYILADTFDGRMGFFVGAGFQIEKFYLNFVAGIGALSLNYPVEASNEADLITFEEGEKFQFYNFNVEAGYALFEKDKIGITPYFSVGYVELDSPDFEYNGENTFFKIYTSTSVGPGVRLQYTLTRIDYRTIYGAVIPAELSFILKGGYNFIPESNEEIFKGDMAYFSFGIAPGTIY